MPLPQINHFLSHDCHWTDERILHFGRNWLQECHGSKIMKIYLLMALIGTLLTVIHFTSAPEQRSKTLPQ
jgi:hypothetical protein